MFKLKKPSTATVVATMALTVAVGGSTAAVAATTSAKATAGYGACANKAGQLSLRDSKGNCQPGRGFYKVTLGAQGPKGATGAKGATGKTGPQGKPGANGAPGKPGKDAVKEVRVTSLGSTWVTRNDNQNDGKAAIDEDGAQLSVTDGDNYAGIATTALNAYTPSDLTKLSFTSEYDQTPDTRFGSPYFKIYLQQGDDEETCGVDHITFNAGVQSPSVSYAGQATTYDVIAPYSKVGVNNDADPVDGPFQVATHTSNPDAADGAHGDVSDEKICRVAFILGAGGDYTKDTDATIYSFTVAGRGLPETRYVFGS